MTDIWSWPLAVAQARQARQAGPYQSIKRYRYAGCHRCLQVDGTTVCVRVTAVERSRKPGAASRKLAGALLSPAHHPQTHAIKPPALSLSSPATSSRKGGEDVGTGRLNKGLLRRMPGPEPPSVSCLGPCTGHRSLSWSSATAGANAILIPQAGSAAHDRCIPGSDFKRSAPNLQVSNIGRRSPMSRQRAKTQPQNYRDMPVQSATTAVGFEAADL